MILPVVTHEDKRRRLIEYISDIPFKRAKVIKVKGEKCILGKHYHNNNDSVFYMLSGKASYVLKPNRPNAKIEQGWIFDEECIFVPRGVVHTFTVYPHSILLEAASEPFNKEDEIQVTD